MQKLGSVFLLSVLSLLAGCGQQGRPMHVNEEKSDVREVRSQMELDALYRELDAAFVRQNPQLKSLLRIADVESLNDLEPDTVYVFSPDEGTLREIPMAGELKPMMDAFRGTSNAYEEALANDVAGTSKSYMSCSGGRGSLSVSGALTGPSSAGGSYVDSDSDEGWSGNPATAYTNLPIYATGTYSLRSSHYFNCPGDPNSPRYFRTSDSESAVR